MNMRNILIINVLLIIASHSIGWAQTFSVIPRRDSTIVEVPFPLKTYTYNKFFITDTSLIVIAPAHKLDVIIADFKQDKRYYLNFVTPYQYIFCQNQELEITDKASVGIDLTQSTSDHVVHLPEKVSWYYHQAFGENGIEVHNDILSDSIHLAPRMYHVLQCSANRPGMYPINVILKKEKKTVEIKNITLTFLKANIKFICTLDEIKNQNYSKEVHYKIQTSKPIPTSARLQVTLNLLINGKKEIIKDSVILAPKSITTDKIVYLPFSGRYPRIYSVDTIFISRISTVEQYIKY